jgi:hypothetical protein
MKKLATGLLAVATVAALMPGVARATETTASETTEGTPGPPTQCWIENDTGPARIVHGRVITEKPVILPFCDEIEGICVEVVWPGSNDGPARIAHRPAGESEITGVPCEPIDPACDFVYYVEPPKGPARAAHHSARPAYGGGQYITVDIPEECQEALSGGLVPAGSDSGNIVWLAALLVGVGGVLVITRRAIAIRTR